MSEEFTIFRDECVDELSDVPIDWEEDISKNESEGTEVEFLDDYSNKEQQDKQEDSVSWSEFDLPRANNDFEGTPGPNIFPEDTPSVEDVVKFFIKNDLFRYIRNETNRYYYQNCNRRKVYKKSGKFVAVTTAELKKWFGLVILMGIIKKEKMDDYWSTNPLIDTPIFRKTMSRNRFRQILSFLHFSDNRNIPDNANRLIKVQPIIDYFSKKFQDNFSPGKNISIYEGVIPWRRRSNLNICNPSKMTKCGVLIRVLCDSDTGYISSFKVDIGDGQPLAKTVMDLLNHSYGKWHHLYMDGYGNSVELAEALLRKKIRVCGTIRHQRGFPEKLKRAKLDVFEACHQRKGEVLAQLWRPSKTKMIRMISTIHNATLIDTQGKCGKTDRAIKIPESVLGYNKYLKGVDRADRFLTYYPICRKTIKWSKKVSIYLFNCALFNAFRTFQHFNTEHKSLRFRDFLLKVCESWIKDHIPSEENSEIANRPHSSRHDAIHRLSGQIKQHQLIFISETDKRKRRNCHVCSKNRKRKSTNLMCKSCGVALHLGDCFAAYHLKEKYYVPKKKKK